MASVTGFTAERMLAIENAAIVSGAIVGDDLILTHFDESTTNAGNVRGPTGSPGASVEDLEDQLATIEALLAVFSPVGSVIDYIGTVAPTNWLAMTGQTVINGETLYPVLWSRIPTSMKSGSNIVMPDTRGRVSVGYNASDTDFNAIGETGGSKTHTLTQAELPAHLHSIAHNHAAEYTAIQSQNHTHNMGHTHTTGTTSGGTNHTHTSGSLATGTQIGTHTHGSGNGQNIATADGVAANGAVGGLDLHTAPGVSANTSTETGDHTHVVNGITGGENNHTHNFDVPSYDGVTGPDNQDHSHLVDLSPYTGNSGNTGSGGSHNNLQPYIVFMKIIKVA